MCAPVGTCQSLEQVKSVAGLCGCIIKMLFKGRSTVRPVVHPNKVGFPPVQYSRFGLGAGVGLFYTVGLGVNIVYTVFIPLSFNSYSSQQVEILIIAWFNLFYIFARSVTEVHSTRSSAYIAFKMLRFSGRSWKWKLNMIQIQMLFQQVVYNQIHSLNT